MNNLELYQIKLNQINYNDRLTRLQKTMKLAALMTEMERQFNIPMLYSRKWINDNEEVFHLYREVSDSRVFV